MSALIKILAVFANSQCGNNKADRVWQGCHTRAYRDIFTACLRGITALGIFLGALASFQTLAHGSHDHDHDDEDKHIVYIEAADAQEAGIVLATAQAGPVERHIQVYGRLVTPPTHQAQVRARFPGLVISLKANTGDAVKKGQVLAVVESNESLQRYEVKAPITGVVQERWLNEGEITGDAPLFTLLNQDELWAELNIFPSQRDDIKVGQHVHIRHNNHDHNSTILSITPNLSQNGATALRLVVARVLLKNEHLDMAPGDKVLGDIDAQTVQAKVRVEVGAIQELEGQPVVFVHHDGNYEAAPVQLGVVDDHYAEVLSGLELGAEYVQHNSYLIKADLGKSEAEHEH